MRENAMTKASRYLAVFIASASCFASAPAWSLEGTLSAGDPTMKVFVWRDKAAASEGYELIRAGVHLTNPPLVASLLACVVDYNTRVVTTSVGIITHDIMVIEGPHAGCRGNIPAEHLVGAR
jgi:hypothetical protein